MTLNMISYNSKNFIVLIVYVINEEWYTCIKHKHCMCSHEISIILGKMTHVGKCIAIHWHLVTVEFSLFIYCLLIIVLVFFVNLCMGTTLIFTSTLNRQLPVAKAETICFFAVFLLHKNL